MNVFDPGADLTALWGGYASSITQAIREAVPTGTFGVVILDATKPDVFTYPWMKRCLWIQDNGSGNYVLYIYDDQVLMDWKNTGSISLPAGSIGTTELAAGSVTLAKLTLAGGAALQLIRRNAINTAWEFVDPAAALQSNTVDVTKLIKPAAADSMLVYTGGVINWALLNGILSYISDNSVGVAKLARGGASTNGTFLATSADGSLIGWVAFDPSAYIANNTIPLAKLVPGSAGQIPVITGGVPVWTTPAASPGCAVISATATAGTDGQAYTAPSAAVVTLNAQIPATVSWMAVASNEIELQAGSYHLQVSVPVQKTSVGDAKYQVQLYNVTGAAVVATRSCYLLGEDDHQFVTLDYVVQPTSANKYSVCIVGDANAILAKAVNLGTEERYTQVTVLRYA